MGVGKFLEYVKLVLDLQNEFELPRGEIPDRAERFMPCPEYPRIVRVDDKRTIRREPLVRLHVP